MPRPDGKLTPAEIGDIKIREGVSEEAFVVSDCIFKQFQNCSNRVLDILTQNSGAPGFSSSVTPCEMGIISPQSLGRYVAAHRTSIINELAAAYSEQNHGLSVQLSASKSGLQSKGDGPWWLRLNRSPRSFEIIEGENEIRGVMSSNGEIEPCYDCQLEYLRDGASLGSWIRILDRGLGGPRHRIILKLGPGADSLTAEALPRRDWAILGRASKHYVFATYKGQVSNQTAREHLESVRRLFMDDMPLALPRFFEPSTQAAGNPQV